jgi:hypothetical protein
VPKPESIREDSFEIVDRKNGEVVAWTKAYFMIDTWLDVLFDIPLAPFAEKRHRCQENGPGLKPLLSEFLRSSRSDGPRRFNKTTR